MEVLTAAVIAVQEHAELLKGPQGDKGEPGTKGAPGKAGDRGPVGPAGKSITGPAGRDGKDGERGPVGPKGDQGPKGDTGDAGQDGVGPDEKVRVSRDDPTAGFLGAKLTAGSGIEIRTAGGKRGERLVIDAKPQGGGGGGQSGIIAYDDGVAVGAGNKVSFDGGDPVTIAGGIIRVPVGSGAGGGSRDPQAWQPAHYVGTWAIGMTYGWGDAVRADDAGTWKLYVSRVDANVGNDPVGDAVNWQDVVADGRSVVIEGPENPNTAGEAMPVVGGFAAANGSLFLEGSSIGGTVWNFNSDNGKWATQIVSRLTSDRDGLDGNSSLTALRNGDGEGGAFALLYAERFGAGDGFADASRNVYRRGSGTGGADARTFAQVEDSAIGSAQAFTIVSHWSGGNMKFGAEANPTRALLWLGDPNAAGLGNDAYPALKSQDDVAVDPDDFNALRTALIAAGFATDGGSGGIPSGGLPGSPETYTETNVVTDRAFDASSMSLDEMAHVLGSLIVDLRARGVVA